MAVSQLVVGLSLVIGTSALLTWYFYRNRRRVSKPLLTDPNVKQELKLIEKEEISHNTRRFRFGLPNQTSLGLTPGQHINLSAVIDESVVVRTYSPVSTNRDIGFMDLIIKVYFKDTHSQFPNGGKMSQFLNNMKPGDSIHIRGPSGKMVYNASTSEFSIRANHRSPPRIVVAKEINMIAGGSGITPMLQILHAVFDPQAESLSQRQTTVSLIFANQSEDDILCRTYLERLSEENPSRLKVWYTLSQPPEGWPYGHGRVTPTMFKTHIFPPSSNTIQLLCGPPPMVQSCLTAFQELNYDASRSYAY